MSRQITADEVADYFLALAHERGESVNNLKLQKLLYYAQAWHLGLHGEPLFEARFEAWVTGPVIPTMFSRFEEFSFHDLPVPDRVPDLSEDTAGFLDDIADQYMARDEYELEWMTRREEPWLLARRGSDFDEPSNAKISEHDMRAYFHDLAEAA